MDFRTASVQSSDSVRNASSTGRVASSHFLGHQGKSETAQEVDARRDVIHVFNSVLNRDPSEAEFLHFRGCILDGELNRDALVIQLIKSFEGCQITKSKELISEYRYWKNPFYPWICIEDEANEELGTVRWERNEVTASKESWCTKDVPPGNSGAQVVDGKLFVTNQDVWISCAVSHGLTAGIHSWSVTKVSGLANFKLDFV